MANEEIKSTLDGRDYKKPTAKNRLDLLFPFGLAGGFAALLGAAMVDGTSPIAFLNLAALIIVVGGAVSASMVQHPWPIAKRALLIIKWGFYPPHYDPAEFIDEIIDWAKKAKSGGLLSMDALIEGVEDPFMRKGLQMAVDGIESVVILKTLRLRLHTQTEVDMMAASLYEAAGGYAPTFGIMGAVTGLIEVMHHLNDPSTLGTGIAAAFVSTIYGLVLANVICIPTANRLRGVIAEQLVARNVFLDGLAGILRGTNTMELREVLESYYLPKTRTPPPHDTEKSAPLADMGNAA
ncbi:flagellar motor protein [Acidithiobacillus ferriphilus]|uniref:flagellar motor protein n=1 Tax=Acidithiobacillus ferriphilus TaxID=1689834 RepID=UPI001C072805|nr:flagellar motor protein [Acidithiobacillus ferriphilus]MBU2845632.1 flagellar motor protein [Acidithiobacillus ferriphilus]UEP60084.1 flagellar motor protein [Acidithiobacillus ferriphilus]